MQSKIERARAFAEKIKAGKISLAISSDNGDEELSGRGIAPLVSAYEKGYLSSSAVADKIVGRAAALIMVLGGAVYCYALTVSAGALKVFSDHGIECEYSELCENIVNREGNGPCPMEAVTDGVSDPREGYLLVKEKIAYLRRASASQG